MPLFLDFSVPPEKVLKAIHKPRTEEPLRFTGMRTRRFAGDDTLPRSRYYTLCSDESGHDAGTLICEMWAYSHVARTGKINLIDMADPTAPRQVEKLKLEGLPASHCILLVFSYWSAPYETGMVFTIERSTNGTDYVQVQSISANSSEVYSYTDASAGHHPALYYRIKAVSISGEVTYSTIQALKITDRPSSTVSIYPNPSNGPLSIVYSAAENGHLDIRMKAANGQQVLVKTVNAVKGGNRIDLTEAGSLAPGIYFIDLTQDGQPVSTQKWIRQ